MTHSPAPEAARRLMEAIRATDRPAIARLLAEQPDLVNHRIDGVDALHAACALVTDNAAIPATDRGPASHAIVDDLLAAGADPTSRAPNGFSPLHTAGFCGNVELIEQLVTGGADPAATVGGVPGSTALSFALFYANTDAARRLDEAGRHPDDLRSAAGLDDIAGVDRLVGGDGTLATGADAGMGFTAPIDAFPTRTGPISDQLTIDESLTWASRNGALGTMARLVAAGADINANPYRGTALLWAVYGNRTEAITWLLDHGADPDHRHDFGGSEHGRQATALHLAAQFGSLDCVELLIGAGADRTIRDAAFDATPREWAEHSGQRVVADRLGP